MSTATRYLLIAVAALVAGGLSFWLINSWKKPPPVPQPAPVADRPGEKPQPREFLVEGMSCPSCAMHIATELKRLPGVQSAEVSLENKRATVVAPASTLPDEKILAAIEAAGYHATAKARCDGSRSEPGRK